MRTTRNGALRRLTAGQRSVYDTLATYGPLPDIALVPLSQHVARSRLSSSGIRTRRSELENLGLVIATKKAITTPSGRKARVYKAV